MKIDDFEEQHVKAKEMLDAFSVVGDGQAPNNAQVITRLIDAYMSLPCMTDEMQTALKMRAEWARLKLVGDDWSKHTTKDLQLLLAYHVAIIESLRVMGEQIETVVILRKIAGK